MPIPRKRRSPAKTKQHFLEIRIRLHDGDGPWLRKLQRHIRKFRIAGAQQFKNVPQWAYVKLIEAYAIETRPTVSSGPVPPFPGAVPSTSTVWTGPVIQLASPDPLRPFADVLREAAADSLTHPEE